jgi:glycosyltransferase involved in cell wall biosynthesis
VTRAGQLLPATGQCPGGPGTAPAYTFTVFTPTYNRAHTLHRVYESLAVQTFRDFEWLICDDGSTDDTRGLAERWRQEASFPIRYVRQEHGGKHVAFNRAVQAARGELFLTLDSDDACLPQALARLKHHWDAIPEAERGRFSAVTALCTDQHGALVGTRFPFDPTDSDSLEIRYRFGVKGEKWGFHRTAVLREFPFPALNGESFVPEHVVWAAIARRYKTRYVNEVLRVYHVGAGADRISGTAVRHARALAFGHRARLDRELDWFARAPLTFLRFAVHYVRFSLHAGWGPWEAVCRLETTGARLLALLVWPVGVAACVRDRLSR